MAIPVQCEGCGYSFRVGDQAAGKRGKCPKCGAIIAVPAAADMVMPGAVDWAAEAAPMTSPKSPLAKKPAATPAKTNIPPWVLLAAGGGVAIVGLLVVVVVLLFSGGSSPPVAKAPPAAPAAPAVPPTSSPSSTPATPTAAETKSKVAKTFDEVTNAIVKFEIPIPGGIFNGSGFLINDRGWVATNNHVAAQLNTAAKAKFFTGQKVDIAGIVVAVPNRDLAIVQLKEMPSNSMILDIGYSDRPKIGTKVYTFGSPNFADFTLAQGIVSRVLTHSEYLNGRPAESSAVKAPADQIWIQTDAKMAPGNSGGPLLDENCRVLGVNTFVNPAAGFASHIKYMKELADTSPNKVTALKAFEEKKPELPTQGPGAPAQFAVSKDGLQKLYDAATAMSWTPKKPEDYKVFADLALALTISKQPKIPADIAALGDQLFNAMKTVEWNEERVNALGQFAPNQINNLNQGFMGPVTLLIKVNVSGQNGWIAKIGNTSIGLVALTGVEALALEKGSRAILMGIIVPKTTAIVQKEGDPAQQIRNVVAPLAIPLK